MRYEITSPDGKRYEVNAPEGASQADVLAYAQSQFKAPEKEAPINPVDEMSTPQRLLVGVGKGMADVGRGIGQRLGMVSPQDVAESRKYDAPLMDTGAGMTGNALGNVALMAPALMVPGANTVPGAAVLGGLSGLVQPTTADESVLRNVGTGAALGGGSQFALGKLASFAGNRLASAEAAGAKQEAQNAVRDATLKASQDAGYVVPPSLAGGGVLSRTLEGISGKYKTNQAAAIKNQNVTDTLARKAIGLADDAPLTRETLQSVRDAAFAKGYEPVANVGAFETDKVFQSALDNIVKDYQGASRSFPGAVKNDVMQVVDSLRTSAFDAGDALKMTRILRDEANKAYASGDNALGKATKQAATAIEDQIERGLQSAGKNGQDMLAEFRNARQLIAKTHSVEKALVAEGGKVNAKVLGAALQRGKPLSGDLKTIGAFANNFKDIAGVPQSGWANPITALDAFQTAGMAGMGAGPMSMALPAARIGARSLVLNPAYQRAMVNPSYGPGLLQTMSPKLLKELEKRGVGGLLAAYPPEQ